MHACIHTYMHACIHEYIHTSIHTCIHTYMHAWKFATFQLWILKNRSMQFSLSLKYSLF